MSDYNNDDTNQRRSTTIDATTLYMLNQEEFIFSWYISLHFFCIVTEIQNVSNSSMRVQLLSILKQTILM